MFVHSFDAMRPHLLKMIQCFYLRFFNLYSLSIIIIHSSKYLPYSTSNARETVEPLEQPNYADENSAQRYKF